MRVKFSFFLLCVEEEVADVWNSSQSLAPGIVETDKYKSDSYQPKVLMSIVKKYNNFTRKITNLWFGRTIEVFSF